ncbi:MAG: PilZ domain-containing protein, partial [Pseudobdellovibrio sp.]
FNMSQTALKKPTGVYIIAVLFLFAPIGNILISFAGSGIKNWYDISVMFPFLQSIPAMDWVWLGLLFVTGILLFRPHKLSWSLAIITLLLVLLINAYRLYNVDSNSIDPIFLKVFSILAIICTLSVLVIASYFRFPYLDRRANWLSNATRFNIRTPASVNGLKALTESISTTGSRLSFDVPSEFKNGEIIKVKFIEVSKLEIDAEVIERLEFGVRVEFNNANADFKQDLDRWLKTRS